MTAFPVASLYVAGRRHWPDPPQTPAPPLYVWPMVAPGPWKCPDRGIWWSGPQHVCPEYETTVVTNESQDA